MKGSGLDRFLNKVVCGDYLDLIPEIPDGSLDLCVTDPPYDLDLERAGRGIASRPNVRIYARLKQDFGNGFDPSAMLELLTLKLKKFNGYFWICNRGKREIEATNT